MLMAALICLPKMANALPAFSNRLGVPCKTCHEPVFPRLNRTGWTFRELGYRTAAEMNTNLSPHAPGDNNPGKYDFGNTISVALISRYDDIQRTNADGSKATTFNDFYVSGVSAYFAGPADSNLGYWAQAQFPAQSTSFSSKQNAYSLSTSTTGVTPWLRFYSGQPGSFFYARAGQINIDGFEGNNSSISSDISNLLTTAVNGSSVSGRGGEVGYSLKDDTLALYVMEPSTTDSITSNTDPGNKPNEVVQYLHFIGKHDSAVQALYVNGSAPTALNSTGNIEGWNSYNQLYLYANWRNPIGGHDATNLLGGYTTGTNHDLVTTGTGSTAVTTSGHSFTVNGYYGELDYEHGTKFVPYVRYDHFNSGDYKYSGSDVNENINAFTIGTNYLPEENIRLNLDYNHNGAEGGATGDTVRAQIYFMW